MQSSVPCGRVKPRKSIGTAAIKTPASIAAEPRASMKLPPLGLTILGIYRMRVAARSGFPCCKIDRVAAIGRTHIVAAIGRIPIDVIVDCTIRCAGRTRPTNLLPIILQDVVFNSGLILDPDTLVVNVVNGVVVSVAIGQRRDLGIDKNANT
jgi:hypothetical protein